MQPHFYIIIHKDLVVILHHFLFDDGQFLEGRQPD